MFDDTSSRREGHLPVSEIYNPLTCGNVINRPQSHRIPTGKPGGIPHTTGTRGARIAEIVRAWQAATVWVQATLRQVARIERAVGVAKADVPLRNALDQGDAVGGAR